MSSSKIVDDVYKTLIGEIKIDDSMFEELAQQLTATIRDRLSSDQPVRRHLSLSSVGKPLRKLWYDIKGDIKEATPPPHMRLKFLYGDIIEDILLWLVKASGHIVTDRQTEVNFEGVKGHIDSIIDGEVVDIKSASPMSFTKFAHGTLPRNDPFGYLAQITAYDNCIGKGNPGFLVMNKVTGELVDYRPDPIFDMPDVSAIVSKAREVLSKDTPPDELCYQPVPDGKSGNMKLDKGCEYCPFKKECFKGLRAFKYADGIKYLTTVVNKPRVEEIEL